VSQRLHLFGIRHHGPGSAASVLSALEELRPDVVLIEGPSDANDVLEFAGRPGLVPPVAILVHEADAPEKSVFYPFAAFSPEWQALRWALKNRKTVRFIDLPVTSRGEEGEESPERADPLTMLAEAAGESDGESWWNKLVEQASHGAGIFPAIEAAMTAVRNDTETTTPADEITLRREASMRIAIGAALGEVAGPVAIVCGAWHVPALRQKASLTSDRALLKGLPKAKTMATWVPWTDSRLAASSGYGAGVTSPGWYRHLWQEYSDAGGRPDMASGAARWQSKVAGLLREEGMQAATASVIEATRLALSIAALRDYAMPGLAEMQDAALAVLCHGDALLQRLIRRRLVIGEAIGEVGGDIPQMPLAEDLARWQKRLRLKPSALPEEAPLDLRSETGFLRSCLFHRLLLIDVPWGQLRDAQAGRGTFREIWVLAWAPELSVKLAEALRFGTTIEQAASNAALEAAEKSPGLARCAELVGLCLNADLAEAAEKLTARLQALSAAEGDIQTLMRAAVPLANILRYGTARKLPLEALTLLVACMAAEVCAGLGPACRGLNEEAARDMFAAMRSFDGAMGLYEDKTHLEAWQRALAGVCADSLAASFLRGFAQRRLYDSQAADLEQTASALSRAMSPAVRAQEAGAWAEGFLTGAAQVLLNDSRLLGILDEWLGSLSEEALMELLPMLRRAVGSFDQMERRRLMEIVRRGPAAPSLKAAAAGDDPHASARFEQALPLIKTILGMT
jgi:Family of unknown function (DUF5682)